MTRIVVEVARVESRGALWPVDFGIVHYLHPFVLEHTESQIASLLLQAGNLTEWKLTPMTIWYIVSSADVNDSKLAVSLIRLPYLVIPNTCTKSVANIEYTCPQHS